MYFKIGVREGNAFSRTLTFSVDCDAENSYFKFYVALKFFYSDVLIKKSFEFHPHGSLVRSIASIDDLSCRGFESLLCAVESFREGLPCLVQVRVDLSNEET